MKIGIIGGSGLYQMQGLTELQALTVETPFGATSDALMSGRLNGVEVVFLPRHGKGHRLLPSEIPFKANVWALKSLGVTHLISVGAVGSLQEEIAPGHIVFPDQFIDRTFMRPSTFFGEGIVAHVQFGDPVCANLSQTLVQGAKTLGVPHHQGGVSVCMEGPVFSTRAESNMYRSWGGTVIGMTNLQEAKLAREAEMCYASIALATDYDCWHESEEEVSVEAVLKVMRENVANAQRILGEAIGHIAAERTCACSNALQGAILTAPDQIPASTKEKLKPIVGRHLS